MKRSRLAYLMMLGVVVAFGLGSRQSAATLPVFLADYAGDTLWAVAVYLAIGLLVPTLSPLKVAMLAVLISYGVELSQLYHAPWIDQARRTWPGRLLLGHGFLWSDLVCYTVGVAVCLAGEIWWSRRRESRED